MGKKSSPTPPAAPDPYKTADAQGELNKETAITQTQLNNMNQYTPQGQITYNQIGTWPDGTPRFEQVMTYSPEQQALYDQQNAISQSLGGLAQDNVQRVADAQAQDFNYDGMTPLQGVTSPTGYTSNVNGGAIQSSFDTGGPLQYGADAGKIQGKLNYSNLEALPQAGDFSDAAQTAADNAYGAIASRLDPQFNQADSDMKAALAAKGISENSDAYRRELDNFARAKNDAYGQAAFNSYSAGLAAQNQGYNQALATRQQGVGEINNQGAFANTAQAQNFGQNMANASLNNQAQGQYYDQNMQAAQFGNQAQNQTFQQGLANAGLNNQSLTQGFQNDIAAASLNNANRQQEIDEATYLRNMPLNDIAALLGTGGGVQQPQFNPYSTAGIASPDLMGSVYASYNANMNQYNQQMAAQQAGLGGLFGLAGTLGAAAISDRRMKHDIKRIGTLANGIATYVFSYLGEAKRRFGVMAQDVLKVKPEAVGATSDGTLYVNYKEIW